MIMIVVVVVVTNVEFGGGINGKIPGLRLRNILIVLLVLPLVTGC